jgi:MFS family permease
MNSALSFPDFRHYLVGRLATVIAQNAMVVIIGWQVYDLARKTMPPGEAALQLGLVGIIQFVPLMALTLVTGWIADHADRRLVAGAAVLLECLCATILALLSWHETMTLPALFAVAALLGVARAFAQPAQQALAPNLVPAAVLPQVIAIGSIVFQVGTITGPPLGGYLYALHHTAPYAVSAVLFFAGFLAMVTIGPVPRANLDRKGKPWRQMIDGLHYVRRNRVVLGAISLDLFAVLLGGATAMLPVFARDVLHIGPEGLGHLRMAPAVGAGLTAIWFIRHPLKHNVGAKMLAAVAVFGAATIVFGFSRWLPLSLACLAVLGAADMLSVYVRQSLMQLYTPDEMRGRVSSVSTLFISGSNELGEAESGFLAALIGPVAAVVAGGVGAIMVVAIWWRWFPELKNARTFEPPRTLENAPAQEIAK